VPARSAVTYRPQRESLAGAPTVKDHHPDYRRISAHSITINRPIVGLTRQHDLPPTNSLDSTITLCYADPVGIRLDTEDSKFTIHFDDFGASLEKPFDFRNNHLLKGSQLALSSPSAKTK